MLRISGYIGRRVRVAIGFSMLAPLAVAFSGACNQPVDGNGNDWNEEEEGEWCVDGLGLCWVNPACGPGGGAEKSWDDAFDYCDELEWAGHGDWRLPTISELRSLIRGCSATMTGGACEITDDCTDLSCNSSDCTDGCNELGGPGPGGCYTEEGVAGFCDWVWSASPITGDPDWENWALSVEFRFGNVYGNEMGNTHCVRCVRNE